MLKRRNIIVGILSMIYVLFSTLSYGNRILDQDTVKTSPVASVSQHKNSIKKIALMKLGKELYENRSYDAAIHKYLQALAIDSSSFKANFELGFVYFESPYEKAKAAPYLERALRHYSKKDTLGEIFYYMAKTYQLNGTIDKSMIAYERYYQMIQQYGTIYLTKTESQELKSELTREIEMCKNAKILMANPVKEFEFGQLKGNLSIVPLNDNINSRFDDYSTLFLPYDSVLIFTSRRKGYSGKKLDFWDDKYFEDIYISTLEPGGWSPAKVMDKTINTRDHDASNSISNDGKTLFIYRGQHKGTFLKSYQADGKWGIPMQLSYNSDSTINSESWESTMNLSNTGDTIYIVSDREGGLGGRDIYWVIKKSDGTFGKPNNIGDSINTKYNEDAPFITSDGKTLYFSSEGHNSMGGFDIFKSEKMPGGWSKPVNLGHPINTTCDDIYFTINHKGDRAYYSSSKVVNGRSDFNIYETKLILAQATEPLLAKVDSTIKKDTVQTMQLTQVILAQTSEPVLAKANNTIKKDTVQTMQLTQVILAQTSKPVLAKADSTIKKDTIQTMQLTQISIKTADSSVKRADVTPEKTITEKPVVPAGTEPTSSFKNILFDFEKSVIREEYFPELNDLVTFLKNNPGKTVLLRGYSDNKGSFNYNLNLSGKRANKTSMYLLKNGADGRQIQVKFSGELNPAAPNEHPDGNDNPEGRILNRRVEIKILEK